MNLLADLSFLELRPIDLVLSLGLTSFIAVVVRQLRFRLETLFPAWVLNQILLSLKIWIVLILLNFLFYKNSPLPEFLWKLDSEKSISSIVQSFPMFLAGILCLAHILPSGKLSRVEWRIWFVLCLGICLLALVEIQIVPRNLFGFRGREIFLPSGLLLIASTLFLFLIGKITAQRLCLLILLFGFAVVAVGAVVVDNIFIQGFQDVSHLSETEETLELLGSLIALAGVAGFTATVTSAIPVQRTISTTSALLVILLFGATLHYEYSIHVPTEDSGPGARNILQISRTLLEERLYARRIEVTIDDTLVLTGWHFDPPQPGAASTIRIWLHTLHQPDYPFGVSVQLLDQAGGSVLDHVDKMSWNGVVDGAEKGKWSPGRPLTRIQAMTLKMPADVQLNRAISLSLSFWEYEGNTALRPLPVSSSDHPLLGNTHVILDELVLPQPVANSSQVAAPGRFANGFVLQEASIPERAQTGAELDVTFGWGAENAGSEDLIQFLHFFHEESGEYQVVDQMPLGARLPTRLWYEGLQSDETWRFTLPPDLQPGRYAIYSGLYRLSDLQRLGVTLADGTQPADARIPLGSILVEG